MSKDLILEKENNVAILTLNRPDKLNAISPSMGEEIMDLLGKIGADDEVRVLIITGAGRGFCAGVDVGAQADRIAKSGAPSGKELLGLIGAFAWKLASLEKPAIAAVNGVAVGIGLAMTLACDIRIAAEEARFAAIWVKRGLMPDGGATYLLPAIVGMSNALYLMYTGDIIGAKEAERIGLVSKVLSAGQLMGAAKDMAKKIAMGPPIPIQLMKRGALKLVYDKLLAGFEFETYGQNICRNSEDHKEGVRSFLEKREAEFKGR